MFKQYTLKVTPLLIASGLLMGGCATKQVWIPELEDAQNTYEQISQDPIVASLAHVELEAARRQLIEAETAANEFRKPHSIAHEAKLAKVKALVAQQRARAQSSNHSLQVALGQQPLLSEELILAATQVPEDEPVLAAANPEANGDAGQQDIAAQLAALSAQLAALQSQIANSTAIAPISSIESAAALSETQPLPAVEPTTAAQATTEITEEPMLAAAMSAPAKQQSLTSPAQLKRQLQAINAKPSNHGMALTLGERYFERGSARLWNDRAARHLDNVASVLSGNPDLELDIEAHTDNTANADDSHNLTIDRALSIKTALVLRGIEADRINTTGYGHTRPVADNATPLQRLQNRRVELIFPNAQ